MLGPASYFLRKTGTEFNAIITSKFRVIIGIKVLFCFSQTTQVKDFLHIWERWS